MSIIRKQPYIEKVIAQLNTQELTSLLAVMNSQETANTSAEFGNLPLTAITPVIFHFPDGYYKTGILLKNTNVLTLICYNSKQQDLELFDLDNTNYKANKVYEYCSISELRRVVKDALGSGGDEPEEYIKEAEVSDDGNTLTLTNKDDTTVVFAPSGSGGDSHLYKCLYGIIIKDLYESNSQNFVIEVLQNNSTPQTQDELLSKLGSHTIVANENDTKYWVGNMNIVYYDANADECTIFANVYSYDDNENQVVHIGRYLEGDTISQGILGFTFLEAYQIF